MTVEARKIATQAPGSAPGREYWWVEPAAIVVGFTLFVIYSAWAVFLASGGRHWIAGPYLSPYYSPLFQFGWWPFSPAIFVFWVPGGFRATCYYYRKAYYRSYFWDPPACALREPRQDHRRYRGERAFPWVLNNLHRFFMYLALIVLGFLWWDTVNAFHTARGLYLGVGSVVMLVNVVLLTGYTFSCHALRHFVGGSVDCFSCARAGNARHGLWAFVSRINPYHGSFAWASLISVVTVDIYIRLISAGAFGHCLGPHTGC